MAAHEATCPVCGSLLLVHVIAHLGGNVEENVGLTPISKQAQTSAALENAQKALDKAQADAVAAAKAVLASAKEG